jgi:hypothetical protein
MSACRQHVEIFRELSTTNNMDMPNIQLLHEFGRQWPHKRTKMTGKMEAGQCYRNAFHLTLSDPGKLTYCEGFAMSPGLIPLEHAWVVDHNGSVIDPTWDKGCDYFGVAFDPYWLFDFTSETGHYGVMGMLYTLRKQDIFAKLRSGLSPYFHAQSIAQDQE